MNISIFFTGLLIFILAFIGIDILIKLWIFGIVGALIMIWSIVNEK